MNDNETRIDLHVHSQASRSPGNWMMEAVNAAESYTTPDQVYDLCKLRGMDLVTITDHDTIDGALELHDSHPDDTFLSEEVSARFPEDGCVVHTMVLDISEVQHKEIQRLRRNIYELASYLHQQDIPFFACHLLSPVDGRLTISHIQRCLLMFKGIEIRNGARDAIHEQGLRAILDGMSPELLGRWATDHPQVPQFNQLGRYAAFGGSDDHAGLMMTRAHTGFTGPATVAGLREAIKRCATVPRGQWANANMLSHNIYGVVAKVLLHTGQVGFHTTDDHGGAPLNHSLKRYATYLDESDRSFDLEEAVLKGHEDATNHRIHDLIDRLLIRAGKDSFRTIADAVMGGQIAGLTQALPELVNTILFSIPYLAGNAVFGRDERKARTLCEGLGFSLGDSQGPKVAILSDTLDEVHGVSLGLRRLVAKARPGTKELRLIGLGQSELTEVDDEGVVRIPSVLWHRFKEYPSIPFGVPSLTSLLNYFVSQRIDLVQLSTPGPLGVAGLAAARMAGIPVIGQYHTDLPEYVSRLTGDRRMGLLVETYLKWFYGKLDQVLAPSRAVMERLASLGVPADKIQFIRRGVDQGLFHPERRETNAYTEFGLNGEPKILYVGRLSREKGLESLLEAFQQTASALPSTRLILVGDGPHAGHLRTLARPDPRIVFTGEQKGDRLATLYASADVFVSPSETETFGNTVVEAQAAGIPVIVAKRGAACENVISGSTGLVVEMSQPEELAKAMQLLIEQPEIRMSMGRAAHAFAQRYSMEAALEGTFEVYEAILRGNRPAPGCNS